MESDLIFDVGDLTQLAAATAPTEASEPRRRLETAQVVIPQGATVVRLPMAPGEVVELPFPADAHFLARLADGNLAIKVGNLTVILQGYVEAAGENPPVIEAANGRPLDIAAILAATNPAIEIETAAGSAGAQGQGPDNTGAILTPFGEAGAGLGGFIAAGGQGDSDAPADGPGVGQRGTLFRQFGGTEPTAPNAPELKFTADEESRIAGRVVATDPQGDPVTYTLVGAAPAGLTFNKDGTWSFDPAGKYDQLNTDLPGQVTFQYKANDGAKDSNTATVTIDINGINDAPELQLGALVGRRFGEDTPNHSEILNWVIDDPDDTAHTITVDSSTLPPGVTFDPDTRTLQYDSSGLYDYLKEGESANFTIKFTVTDAHGGWFEHDFGLTISGESDAPVATGDIVLTNAGTGTYGIFAVPEWALLVNDKDADSAALDVSPFGPFGIGFESLQHAFGNGNAGSIIADEDETLGGSFTYRADDGGLESNAATVNVQNQEGGDVIGTDADEILVSGRSGGKLDGRGGNDVLLTPGGSATFQLYGGAGDDILQSINSTRVSYHGGTDSVASSGGLAVGAANHGDVLVAASDGLDLAEIAGQARGDGIETISSEAKFGSGGAQRLTVTAASVQQLSDHTITPGSGFGEHEAIRIDSDSLDQIQLLKEGGNWVDTGIEMAGYRIYANETSGGDPASTYAYVMVQAANTGNVDLNPPVVGDDQVLTTAGANGSFSIPIWALLANDSGDAELRITQVTAGDFSSLGVNSEEINLTDNDTLGGTLGYRVTDGKTESADARVDVANTNGNDLSGGNRDEILIGTSKSETLKGGGGDDIIIGNGSVFFDVPDSIFGGAGDDIIAFDTTAAIHGDTDSLAVSGGLAAGADQHGDVLLLRFNANLADPAPFSSVDGIETISTAEKFGAVGTQALTIGAGTVQRSSDHTVTPGGDFGEHEAIRIDGDAVDQLYLSVSQDGGSWIDTNIEMAGYHVYAHVTGAEKDPSTTDAYVMVQAANVGNVRLNHDGVPAGGADTVLANTGENIDVFIPEWALLANDKSVDGAALDVGIIDNITSATDVSHTPGTGSAGTIFFDDDASLGGSFTYKATDNGLLSGPTLVTIQNQSGGDITGTAADEILVAGKNTSETLDGAGGNDIIFGSGGSGHQNIFGGAGDDIIDPIPSINAAHGGTDNVASSGGLASSADNHGDTMIIGQDLDLEDPADAANLDGIETISSQSKFGSAGGEKLTISAASVQLLSDHTITPGGGFGEHDAIRIDGDLSDQLYLSTSKDGGTWVDTGIDAVGYRIYAHETIEGDAASTDAYVMVQAANVATVRYAPVAGNDVILTDLGTLETVSVPEWALLANDRSSDGAQLDVALVGNGVGSDAIGHQLGTGSNGTVDFHEDGTLGGSFIYTATDGSVESRFATVSVENQNGGDITGTAADEILVAGKNIPQTLDGDGGNDVIFGSGGSGHQSIFGGAGDDIIVPIAQHNEAHGGTDTVAANGGLALSVSSHGDVLSLMQDLNLADSADAASFDGFETISTEDKSGAGAAILTIGAASVQQLSDHAIIPGGVFAEHEAIRIDGDSVDLLYLSINKDGGKWIDTAIEMAGYHIYAHETAGDAASTDAYVMVQTSNTNNVNLNQDPP